MAYVKQTWVNTPTGGTPLNETRLNHMEDGISDAHDLIDTHPHVLTDGADVTGTLPMGMVAFPHSVVFAFSGNLAQTVEGEHVWTCEYPAATIIHCRASLGKGSSPAAADVIVDINRGTSSATPTFDTIYTTQANRPRVLVGQQRGDVAVPDIRGLDFGDQLTVDIDQVGGGATPTDANLTVSIYMIIHGYPADTSYVPGTSTGT